MKAQASLVLFAVAFVLAVLAAFNLALSLSLLFTAGLAANMYADYRRKLVPLRVGVIVARPMRERLRLAA